MNAQTQITPEERLKETHDAALAAIVEMVEALETARENDDYEAEEEAQQAIHEDPLSLQVRDGWRSVHEASDGAEEFELLLSTGGPAVRIIGTIGQYGEPDSCTLQVQDWFQPWTEFDHDHDAALMTYCEQFYFGEG